MIFELLHAPFPDGYGDSLIPLDECKAHLRVTSGDEDDLILILRDAALEFVEQYCSVRLGSIDGLEWFGTDFPTGCGIIPLGASPVTQVVSVSWLDQQGEAASAPSDNFRVTNWGELRPAIGHQWPRGVGGDVQIMFNAGYSEGQAPRSLLMAAKMFLGHLWSNREAVVDNGAGGEIPLGVRQLCAPFRRIVI